MSTDKATAAQGRYDPGRNGGHHSDLTSRKESRPVPLPHNSAPGTPSTRDSATPSDVEERTRAPERPTAGLRGPSPTQAGRALRDARTSAGDPITQSNRSRGAPPDLYGRCATILALAPNGSAISHETSAFLHGLWLPRPYESDGPIHVTRPAGTSRFRRRGVIEHDSVRGIRLYTLVRGLQSIGTTDTWADLAGTLSLLDLVALGDGLARRTDGATSLLATLKRRKYYGCRHTRKMEKALALVRTGCASYMESRARLLFVADGLPEPELNVDVVDCHGGWLATVDFLWLTARLIVEYQSEVHHGAPKAREADERRRRLLEAAGYRVVFITASTVFEERYARELLTDLRATLQV